MKHYLAIAFAALGFVARSIDAAVPAKPLPNETLLLSGAIPGSWSNIRTVRCDLKTGAGQAHVVLMGAVNGAAWTLSLDIGPYKGPGSYDSKIARATTVDLGDGSHNPNTYFDSTGDGYASITVAVGGRSGTVHAVLQSDTGRSVRIDGPWKC